MRPRVRGSGDGNPHRGGSRSSAVSVPPLKGRSHPRHPPDVHAPLSLAAGGFLDQTARLPLRGQRQRRRRPHADHHALEAGGDFVQSLLSPAPRRGGLAHFPRAPLSRRAPLHQRVVHERLQHGHERLAVAAEHRQSDLARAHEDALVPPRAQPVDDVLRQPKRHHLRRLELQPLVEEAREVDVHAVAAFLVQQDVLAVPVPQADDVPHHAPHRGGVRERGARAVPRRGPVLPPVQEPPVEHRRKLFQNLAHPRRRRRLEALVRLLHLRERALVVQAVAHVQRLDHVPQPGGVRDPFD
mmetsp:Transcript_9405/g.39498  ORF Transcript_9405/g.39498 Transcript_9405/m.39498 type:complete len:298 (-) Transcript_9405:979-1872(-)